MRLSFKIGLYVLAVLCFAVALTSYLTYSKFRSLHEEIESSRFEVIALDLKSTIERSLDLGLQLEQMENIAPLVDRTLNQHPTILSLEVVNAQRESLYHGGRTVTQDDNRPVALGHMFQTRVGAPQVRDPQTLSGDIAFGLAVPLVNSFDQTTGAIVLYYSRLAGDSAAAEVLRRMMTTAFVVLGLGGLGAVLAVGLQFRPMTRSIGRMTEWARAFAQGRDTGIDAGAYGDDSLEARLAAAGKHASELRRTVKYWSSGPRFR